MKHSEDGIWWNKEKVDQLVGNVKKHRDMVASRDRMTFHSVYVESLKETLTTMYGEEFTSIVSSEIDKMDLIENNKNILDIYDLFSE